MPMRIAMWSGPRSISTALMRSWGNRPDTFVCDEPFYAHYLEVTGLRHPGADEVIAHHETDCPRVIAWLTGPIPGGREIFYQKHMAHHLLPDVPRGWLDEVSNCFLIRDPREMLTSLIGNIPNPTLADTGLAQQVELFEQVRQPVVIDAREVLEDPRGILTLLCDAVGVEFSDAMLSWPPGRRDTDGVWAPHWYESVERSTGFRPYAPKFDPVPERLAPLYDACLPHYEQLYEHRLR